MHNKEQELSAKDHFFQIQQEIYPELLEEIIDARREAINKESMSFDVYLCYDREIGKKDLVVTKLKSCGYNVSWEGVDGFDGYYIVVTATIPEDLEVDDERR